MLHTIEHEGLGCRYDSNPGVTVTPELKWVDTGAGALLGLSDQNKRNFRFGVRLWFRKVR